jgi:hypothetical protein
MKQNYMKNNLEIFYKIVILLLHKIYATITEINIIYQHHLL